MASDNILVTIFLRGGCDGLNLVGPSADPIYRTERRADTRVERDGDAPGLVLKNTLADVDFRFHHKAQALKEFYDAGHLAIVHACGLTNGTRSHFEATDYMERGTPENKNTSSGWLTRLVSTQPTGTPTSVLAINNSVPASLLACPYAIAVPNVKKMQLQGDGHYKSIREAILQQAYQGTSPIAVNARRSLEVLDVFAQRLPHDDHGKILDYTPSPSALYPTDGYANELSNSLKTLAQIIKMDVGARFATVDYGGWDTHVGQNGRFTNLVDGLSRSLAAFWNDISAVQDHVTIVVMSEFGRRLKSNDSGGTDHGHGNAMLVMGGHVKGGNIYGQWPGLETEHLDNQVDLAITTDYRSVLGEIASQRFGIKNLNTVFPNFAGYKSLGLVVS